MHRSRNIRHGGGGAGVHVNMTKKALTALFVCLCLFFAFSFFLVLGLFYRSQMVNFKQKYHFSRFRRGSKLFQGVQLFPGRGSNCLFPIKTQITCDFPGGVGPDPLPPSGSALGCDLFSFPVRKMMRTPLAPVLVFLQLRVCFSRAPQ